jgi:branched-subunit amino acid aminotransferase/4-amino-4-deoxychorismate lyase
VSGLGVSDLGGGGLGADGVGEGSVGGGGFRGSGCGPTAIAWLGDPWEAASRDPAAREPVASGAWGAPAALALPLDDRGLLLADGLFETLLVEEGHPWRLEEHRQRWRRAAELLELPPPPPAQRLLALLAEAVARSGADGGVWRLNVSRGGGGRGLEPPPAPGPEAQGTTARFWLSYSPGGPRFEPVRLVLSRLETRNASSRLSRCKTFAYGGSLLARREARARGADDALLASSAGGLCCASAANLLVRLDGRWRTPPLRSGCLPGILRGLALERGLAVEQPLSAEDLATAEGALLINSLGCRPVVSFEGTALPAPNPGQAEALWRGLLEDDAKTCRDFLPSLG